MAAKRSSFAWFTTGLISGVALSFIALSVLAPTLFDRKSEKGQETSITQVETKNKKSKNRKRTPEVEMAAATEQPQEQGESDSMKVISSADTQYTKPANSNPELDEIVLAQDELLFRRMIAVSNDSIYAGDEEVNIDSLLIDDWNDYPTTEAYQVEFWASPINYKGYRLQKEKLVLYGLDHFEDASLWRISQKLYLRYHDKYYLLTESPDFSQLINVSPEGSYK